MHKKASVLSELCRSRGDPEDARRAIGRAQCNDAYWHGVFGGLYLRHLRNAVWANLAEAEGILRREEGLEVEVLDLDGDGREEVWIHSSRLSALVAPSRGGALEELTSFQARANLADVLTRRRESYHRTVDAEERDAAPRSDGPDEDAGMPSIHDMEEDLAVRELPPADAHARAILVDRVLEADVSEEDYVRGRYQPLASWAGVPLAWTHAPSDDDAATLEMHATRGPLLEKALTVTGDGRVSVVYRWDPSAYPLDARFAPELSVAREVELEMDPPPEAVWRYEIRTVAKSERGTEETVQGVSLTPLWPASAGEARISFRWS
jgi:alpha-amylase